MKKLKVLFTVLCVACATTVWGEDVTVTFKASDLGGSNNSYALKSGTVNGIGFSSYSYKNTGNFQFNGSKGKNIFYNTSALPGPLKSIKATKASGTDREVTAYISKSAITSSNYTSATSLGSQTVSTSGATWSLSEEQIAEGYTFFYLHYPTSSALYVTQFEVTYSSGSKKTTVSFTPSSIDFGSVPVGETKTQNVSVTIDNPTSSVNFSVTGSGLSVSPSSLSQNGTVTVTYKPTTAGTLNGTLTASGGGLKTDVTATITGTAQASATTYYTVTWMVGGQKYTEGNPTTSVTGGSKVTTLPDAPADNSLSCAEKFMGWSTQNIGATPKNVAPADLFTTADASPAITQDTTFYAVFAKPKQSE